MGYTHYWRGKGEEFSATAWAKICEDIRKLIADSGVPVWREYDEPNTCPEITDSLIRFNGTDDDGHETFWLNRRPAGFTFCKTACKPYDVLVCAALTVAHRHGDGVISVSSDGDERDWKPAMELITKTLGCGYELPLESEA